MPFDTIGTGVLADANKIIAEAEGGNPEDPIKLIQNDQITIVNLDGMRAANQNYIKVKFPFEHEYAPIVTFGIEYDGGDETMSYLGAMVVGKASTKDVSFLFTEIPPSDGYSLYVRSASGNTKTREFIFKPWSPTVASLFAWYDASDISTITESAGVVSQVDDKSDNGFHLNVLTANKVGPKTGVETLNNLNVLTWDLPAQVLENNSFAYDQNSNGLYLAVIFKCNINNQQDFIIAGTENSGPGNRMSVRRNGNLNSIQILGGSGTGSSIALSTPQNTANEGEDLLLVVKFNGSNSTIRIDGEIENSGNIGTNPFSSLNVGANESELAPINGYIAELVFFEDSSAQEKMEGYLAHKWGTSSKLPQGHPYKFVTPQA